MINKGYLCFYDSCRLHGTHSILRQQKVDCRWKKLLLSQQHSPLHGTNICLISRQIVMAMYIYIRIYIYIAIQPWQWPPFRAELNIINGSLWPMITTILQNHMEFKKENEQPRRWQRRRRQSPQHYNTNPLSHPKKINVADSRIAVLFDTGFWAPGKNCCSLFAYLIIKRRNAVLYRLLIWIFGCWPIIIENIWHGLWLMAIHRQSS